MTEKTKTIVRFLLALVAVVALVGANVNMYLQLRKHADVINRQGTIIKLMLETPEINGVVSKELERRQAVTPK